MLTVRPKKSTVELLHQVYGPMSEEETALARAIAEANESHGLIFKLSIDGGRRISYADGADRWDAYRRAVELGLIQDGETVASRAMAI